MGTGSDPLLALRPVTFRYRPELDSSGIHQFGLVAEEVQKMDPDLVLCDAQGKPYGVRYEAVNAMLLNEFLKEHRKVAELETTIAQLKSNSAKQEATAAQQQEEIKALTAALKQQAKQIERVNALLPLTKPVPQLTSNN
jgi:ABC-type hemin transport system substrate-binding protein